MSLNALRDEARLHLLVFHTIVGKQGRDIDVGEEFTVRFTVLNTFTGSEGESPGHAHFNDVKIKVESTLFAEVVGGNRTIDITDHLGYGRSASIDVKFRAIRGIAGGLPITPFVQTRVEADFDIVRFFKVVQEDIFLTDIDVG